jgi:hypothetical protein
MQRFNFGFPQIITTTINPQRRVIGFLFELQRAKPRLKQARRREGGVHSSAWWREDGATEAYERSAVFKKGQRFRAGIEGRISVLFEIAA